MSLPSLKLTSLMALMCLVGAIGIALAFLFLKIPPDRYGVILILIFVLAAVLFAFPKHARGWITRALNLLPSWGRRAE